MERVKGIESLALLPALAHVRLYQPLNALVIFASWA